MNFQQAEPGVYDYINIGSWHEGILSLDEEMIRMNRSDMVRSVCSEPCSKGEIKVRNTSLTYRSPNFKFSNSPCQAKETDDLNYRFKYFILEIH